jgi:AcrR family transcriptional regulator
MGRWEPNAGQRLQAAGLELFEERGYEQTTVADIAAAAGLTERTFFRYFADKREVLFSGSSELRERMVAAVREAPEGSTPLEAVAAALDATAKVFAERHVHARRRQQVLAANPVLAEREAAKMSLMVGDLSAALRERGVVEPTATLTAEIGVLAFRTGFAQWLEEGGSLAEVFPRVLAQLRAAATA